MYLDDFIIGVFCLVDEAIPVALDGQRLRQRGPASQLIESEVITMDIVGEYLGLEQDSALNYAHSDECVIRRDIKPGNILLDENGKPYLADFCIVRLLSETHKMFTRTSASASNEGASAIMMVSVMPFSPAACARLADAPEVTVELLDDSIFRSDTCAARLLSHVAPVIPCF